MARTNPRKEPEKISLPVTSYVFLAKPCPGSWLAGPLCSTRLHRALAIILALASLPHTRSTREATAYSLHYRGYRIFAPLQRLPHTRFTTEATAYSLHYRGYRILASPSHRPRRPFSTKPYNLAVVVGSSVSSMHARYSLTCLAACQSLHSL
jgi:hypothetical protein